MKIYDVYGYIAFENTATSVSGVLDGMVAAEPAFVQFKELNLANLPINGVNLSNKNMEYSNFSGAIFDKVNFSKAKLNDCNLSNTTFNNCSFDGTIFTHANLRGASFISCTMPTKIDCAFVDDLTNFSYSGIRFKVMGSIKLLCGHNVAYRADKSGMLLMYKQQPYSPKAAEIRRFIYDEN